VQNHSLHRHEVGGGATGAPHASSAESLAPPTRGRWGHARVGFRGLGGKRQASPHSKRLPERGAFREPRASNHHAAAVTPCSSSRPSSAYRRQDSTSAADCSTAHSPHSSPSSWRLSSSRRSSTPAAGRSRADRRYSNPRHSTASPGSSRASRGNSSSRSPESPQRWRADFESAAAEARPATESTMAAATATKQTGTHGYSSSRISVWQRR